MEISDEQKEYIESFFSGVYATEDHIQTVKNYDLSAEKFHKYIAIHDFTGMRSKMMKTIKEIFTYKNVNILDYGCGSGPFGLLLKEAGYINVDGCDGSEEMLKVAKSTECYGDLHHTWLGNTDGLLKYTGKYDICVGHAIICKKHVKPKGLLEMFDSLKKEGMLIIAFIDIDWEDKDLSKEIIENINKIYQKDGFIYNIERVACYQNLNPKLREIEALKNKFGFGYILSIKKR